MRPTLTSYTATVEVIDFEKGSRDSLSAQLTLIFKAPIRGPLLLGAAATLMTAYLQKFETPTAR